MAEFLIKAVSATNSDSMIDQRGCYKRGDIVDVQETGFSWGALELKPPAQGGKFVVLNISDVTIAQVKNFLQTRWGIDPTSSEFDVNFNIARRRRLQVLVDTLPAGVLSTLNNIGRYTNTWSVIKAYVQDKVSQQTV